MPNKPSLCAVLNCEKCLCELSRYYRGELTLADANELKENLL